MKKNIFYYILIFFFFSEIQLSSMENKIILKVNNNIIIYIYKIQFLHEIDEKVDF